MSYEFAGSLADEIIVAAIGTAPASVPAIMLIQASSGGPVNFTTGAVATGGIAGVSDVSWASYCQDMVRMQTSTPTNSPFYVSDVDFVGLPLTAGNYIAMIWDDSAGPGDDIVAAINLRYQDSTWSIPENNIRTVVDAVKVKTDFLPSATAGAAGGVFIAGTNAATTITSASGSALTLSSTGGNGHGVVITGNGGGEGIKVTAGATGNGIEVTTQTGTAILAQAVTDGSGILATGAGTGDDIALGNNDIPDIVAGLALGTPAGASISADIAAIDTVVDAILVDTGTTLPASLSYAKDDVNDKRTWTFTKNTNSTKSPRIVTVHPDFDGTLKFDLTNVLNSGAGINAITSVTVDPTGPTVSGPNGNANPAKTSDNRCVLFDIDGAQIDNTDYTFTCTVTTTDSDDALIVTGVMKARSV